jgi:hypothetical protein
VPETGAAFSPQPVITAAIPAKSHIELWKNFKNYMKENPGKKSP